jgi:UPF0716 family protein affecting phage T7 exclusion
MVAEGKMTQDQMNTQMNNIQNRMDQGITPIQIVFQGLAIFIGGFIIFFIITAIYFLFARFVLKGEGTYQSALVASGMTAYIGIIETILVTILAFVMGRMLSGFSVAAFMDADTSTLGGFFLAKINVITIWSYIVLGIGLAKMFKSSSTMKYFLTVFGIWIIGGFLLFLLAEAVPFLKFFGI